MNSPLSDRMRPRHLSEIVGQEHWLAEGAPLWQSITNGKPRSIILWGPPGCGKTSTAMVIAKSCDLTFTKLSAVLDGVQSLRKVLTHAEKERAESGKPVLLFVDEIHRWNKAQQDALLPHVERGDIVLIGATTENPSFQLIPALRSRLQVIALTPIETSHLTALLQHALIDEERGLGLPAVTFTEDALKAIAVMAAGDCRRALDDLERSWTFGAQDLPVTVEVVQQALQRTDIFHDRDGEGHYNVLSALIKSMRASDPDAALYWLARMIVGGEDPTAIARRLVIFASEDIGNADTRALAVATDAAQAVALVGLPECRLSLAQAVTWLATSPKSNAAYLAINAAMAEVRQSGGIPVPLHLRSPSSREMREAGYGDGYLYPHDYPNAVVDQPCLPESLIGARYYEPSNRGDEKTILARMAWWREKRKES
jgi:putative ATPase